MRRNPVPARQLAQLALTVAVINAASAICLAGTAVAVTRLYGPGWAGLLVGLAYAVQAPASLPVGRLLDARGARTGLRLCQVLFVVTALSAAVAAFAAPGAIAIVAVTMVLMAARSAGDVILVAAPVQLADRDDRWISRANGMKSVGYWACGPIGIALASTPKLLLVAVAVLIAVSAFMIPRRLVFLVPDGVPAHFGKALRQLAAVPGYQRIFVFSVLWNLIAGMAMLVLLPLALATTSAVTMHSSALAFGFAGAVFVGTIVTSRQMALRPRDQLLTACGCLIQLSGVVFLAGADWSIVAGGVLIATGNVVALIALSTGRVLRAGPALAGLALSVPKIPIMLALAVGSPLAGWLVEIAGLATAIVVTATAFMLLAALLLIADRREQRRGAVC